MVRYIPEAKKASGVVIRNYDGDGSTTTFAITEGMTVNKLQISLNGITQTAGVDFTVVASNVVIGGAPAFSDVLTITELPI
jgi:hypothetical protein